MSVINAILNPLAKVCFAPFVYLPPWLTMVFWSAVGGLFMMIVFKYTSRQQKLKEISNRTRAALLGMKLFKDELSVMFSCQGSLFKATGGRLFYSFWPPLIVMIVPFVLGMAQLGARYQFRPLRPEESALVTLHLSAAGWAEGSVAALDAPPQVDVETPSLRIESEHAVLWRVHADEPGRYELAWQINGQRFIKTFEASRGLVGASPRRPTTGFWDQLLYPLERPFGPDSPVLAIDVALPDRSTPIFGLDVHWLITFFVLSMVFALVFKPFLKVQL